MIASVRPPGKLLWQLEAARGTAASYIAIAHLMDSQREASPFLSVFLRFGQEAVILFFLLSGFVIHWSTAHKPDIGFGSYIRARALRIYPLFILTLVLSAIIVRFNGPSSAHASLGTFVGNLLMLQDCGDLKPGVWVEPYADVLTLWSLSYEWWFYILYFPISKKIPANAQAWVVAAISVSQALVYDWHPNQASRFLIYFCIWWVGVELAKAVINKTPLNLRGLSIPLGTVALVGAILALGAWRWHETGGVIRPGTYPILEIRHVAAALLITGVALVWNRWRWAGFKNLFGPFIFVAPWSYALYLLHAPVAHSGLMNFVPQVGLQITLNILLSCTLAWLAEKYFQTWCRHLFSR